MLYLHRDDQSGIYIADYSGLYVNIPLPNPNKQISPTSVRPQRQVPTEATEVVETTPADKP